MHFPTSVWATSTVLLSQKSILSSFLVGHLSPLIDEDSKVAFCTYVTSHLSFYHSSRRKQGNPPTIFEDENLDYGKQYFACEI